MNKLNEFISIKDASKKLNLSTGDFTRPTGINPKLELDCGKYNEDREQSETIEFNDSEF